MTLTIEKSALDKSLHRKQDFKINRALLEASGRSSAEVNAILLSADGFGRNPAFPNAGMPPFPAKGSPKLPVILVEFEDYRASNFYGKLSPEEISKRIFESGDESDFPYESVRNYYQRASNNQMNLRGEVLGWVKLGKRRQDYAPQFKLTDTSEEKLVKHQNALYQLFTEAMASIDEETDFSVFDNNQDGEIDAVVMLYAGPKGSWGDFFWAYQWSFWTKKATGPDAIEFDGKTIRKFVFQFAGDEGADRYDNRTLLHEFGHLIGIRDYYDYCPSSEFELTKCGDSSLQDPGPDGGIGGFDMMHANRANHNAYSRWLLDWIKQPNVIGSGSKSFSLLASGDNADTEIDNQAVAIFPDLIRQLDQAAPAREMFIAELRTELGNDKGTIPSGKGGIAIWHVAADPSDSPSKTRYDNSYTKIKHLRLIREGKNLDYSESGQFSHEDLFQAGEDFGPGSLPSSLGHDGLSTGVSITDISISGSTASAVFSVRAQADNSENIAGTSDITASNTGIVNIESRQPEVLEDISHYENVDLDELLQAQEIYSVMPAEELSNLLREYESNPSSDSSLKSIFEIQIISAQLAQRDVKKALEITERIASKKPATFESLPQIAADSAVQRNPNLLVELLALNVLSPNARVVAAQSLIEKDTRFKEYVELTTQANLIDGAINIALAGTAANGGRAAILRARAQQMEARLSQLLQEIIEKPQSWLGPTR